MGRKCRRGQAATQKLCCRHFPIGALACISIPRRGWLQGCLQDMPPRSRISTRCNMDLRYLHTSPHHPIHSLTHSSSSNQARPRVYLNTTKCMTASIIFITMTTQNTCSLCTQRPSIAFLILQTERRYSGQPTTGRCG